MPEIAEVELVRRGLLSLEGQTIAAATVSDPKLGIVGREHELTGRTLIKLLRHGKLLGFELDNGNVLACHLRMTGVLSLDADLRARALLTFESGDKLSFRDPRRFGTLDLLDGTAFASRLGPDLFAVRDDGWPPPKAVNSKRAIKAAMLDQSLLAGVGNYVVDEGLYLARLHPETRCVDLTDKQWLDALAGARQVATDALEAGGMTIRDYRQPDGSSGEMQHQLQCYGRDGKPCLRCATTLIKVRVAGRGTTLCPSCQPRPE